MSIAGTQIWNVNASGADTNGGGFDYAQVSLAGFADLQTANGTSSSPVVTSSSYTFLAGDIGHWLHVSAGSNWIFGWYQIASVAGGAATLKAGVGQARMAYNQATGSYAGANGSINTGAGISTIASNTNSNAWAIDRSYSTGSYASGNVAATNPAGTGFTPGGGYVANSQDVGNSVNVISGTGATTGWFTIVSVAGGVWTLDRSAGSSASGITWKMGGALATVGQLGNVIAQTNVGATNQRAFVTGNQTVSSGSTNVSGGLFSLNAAYYITIEGYSTVQGDLGAWPTINVSSQSGVSIFTVNNSSALLLLKHLCLYDNGTNTNNLGVTASTGPCSCEDCLFFMAAVGGGAYTGANPPFSAAIVRGCYALTGAITSGGPMCIDLCEFDSVQVGTGNAPYVTRTLVHNSPGVGLLVVSADAGIVEGVTVYNCGGRGIENRPTIGSPSQMTYSNVIVYGNGSTGIHNKFSSPADRLLNVASGNNAGGRTQVGASSPLYDPLNLQILLTTDPFQNLNGGVTSTNGTNLTIDASNPLKVTPDVNAPWLGVQAADLGLKLIVLPGANINAGIYTITSVGSNFWILNASPAATSTSGISWRISDFRPNTVAGGGALLRGHGYPIPTQAG